MDYLVETWSAGIREEDLADLAEVLHECVHAGASVSFVLPFSVSDARAFWSDRVVPYVQAGSRIVVVARMSGDIVGTVQLDTATPPNQPHRADVKKLLVHPRARRLGIARALMIAVEREAQRAGRSLLTLDTVSKGAAEGLYRSLGYEVSGVIPRYALNHTSSVLEPTTVMYKEITPDKR